MSSDAPKTIVKQVTIFIDNKFCDRTPPYAQAQKENDNHLSLFEETLPFIGAMVTSQHFSPISNS